MLKFLHVYEKSESDISFHWYETLLNDILCCVLYCVLLPRNLLLVTFLSRLRWYAWGKWRFLVRMIGYTPSLNHIQIQPYRWFTHTLVLSWYYNLKAGTIRVSLNYTLPISLYYSTHKVFNSQVNSSSNTNFPWLSPTENSELCYLLVSIRSLAFFSRYYFSRNCQLRNSSHLYSRRTDIDQQ
jgi:hypothetical protein